MVELQHPHERAGWNRAPRDDTNAIVAKTTGQRVQPLAQLDGALTIWSGGSFVSLSLTNGNRLQMQFEGPEGRQYVFETSTNLTDWVVLSPNTVTGGIINLPEINTGDYLQRFYRTRLLP